MIIKIFTQVQCPNCPPAKALGKILEEKGYKVKYFDVKQPSGLAEAVMHNIMATPSIAVVSTKGKELEVWRSKVPMLSEITGLKE